MKKHTLDVDTLRRINRLCEIGARPPVIKALLPAAHDTLIRTQWDAFQDAAPPKGRLPMLVEWFLSNYNVKLQSSYIASVWRRASDNKVHYVDAYLAAYDQYIATFPEPLLTFDRAWYLIRTLSTRMMTTVTCPDCDSEYIHNPNELTNHKTCPCCRVFGLRQNSGYKAKPKREIISSTPREPVVSVRNGLIDSAESKPLLQSSIEKNEDSGNSKNE